MRPSPLGYSELLTSPTPRRGHYTSMRIVWCHLGPPAGQKSTPFRGHDWAWWLAWQDIRARSPCGRQKDAGAEALNLATRDEPRCDFPVLTSAAEMQTLTYKLNDK